LLVGARVVKRGACGGGEGKEQALAGLNDALVACDADEVVVLPRVLKAARGKRERIKKKKSYYDGGVVLVPRRWGLRMLQSADATPRKRSVSRLPRRGQ